MPNVELTWNIDDAFMAAAKFYGTQMLRTEADPRAAGHYDSFINRRFVHEIAE